MPVATIGDEDRFAILFSMLPNTHQGEFIEEMAQIIRKHRMLRPLVEREAEKAIAAARAKA